MTTINLGATGAMSAFYSYIPVEKRGLVSIVENTYKNLQHIIKAKFDWYVKNTKVEISVKGLDKVAGQISGDLIREGKKKVDGQGVSKDDIKILLLKYNYFSVLWSKTKDILKPPTWVYWAIGGLAVLAVMVVATPYVKLGSQLLPRRR